MILHLSPSSGSIELHIHDAAQVALYQAADKPALVQADPATSSRPKSHWLVLGLTGAVCLSLGYGVAPRGSTALARVVGPAALIRPVAPLPSNMPLAPDATSLPRHAEPDVAVPSTRSRADAEATNGVPAALARQMAQPPIVVPPSASARLPAGSSAFGLDN